MMMSYGLNYKCYSFAVLALLLVGASTVVSAQGRDTTRIPSGVVLGTRYTVLQRPLLAVRPVGGDPGLGATAQQVTQILERDLDYSDRFQIVATPATLATGEVKYDLWRSLNVVFLVSAELEPSGDGSRLAVTVHDVPFTRVKQTQSFALPAVSSPQFRMAVHAVSDEIVRWLTGQPGAAASRIAYTRWLGNSYELWIVDSDGENARRLISAPGAIYSPTFSPDGRKLAYGARRGEHGRVELRERDLVTNEERVISDRPLMSFTPSYAPDGKRIAFSIAIGSGNEIHDYDLEKRCCMRRLTRGPRSDVSPTYSPDGSRIAFHSDRAGQSHIYVMSAEGGEATLLTPYTFGDRAFFTSPDWSPTSNEIVFHGESRGGYQIMVADASRPGSARQVTDSGNNEDPSWAPDGKHVVYAGVGRGGSGLYVIDTQSGRIRTLVSGARIQMPEWSGSLAPAAVARATN